MSGNNSLVLRALEGDIIPEEQTFQARLRQAAYDGVGAQDVTDIVKGITAKAKAGDPAAVKLFFDYVLGQKTKPTSIVVHNHFDKVEDAARLGRKQKSA